MRREISGIGVVIPARNEEALLGGCLAAVDAARAQLRSALGDAAPWVRLMVVLDSCTDGTAAIASEWSGVDTVSVDFGAVGAARREGIRRLLADDDAARMWIANTDADSRVPENWLLRQWELAAEGAELMLGTVRPDFADLSEAQRGRWLAAHIPGARGNVHGANLGFRAERYIEAGGFEPVAEHEDALLVAALRRLGARSVATDDCPVLTSGRAQGRTPGGYAANLHARLGAESGLHRSAQGERLA